MPTSLLPCWNAGLQTHAWTSRRWFSRAPLSDSLASVCNRWRRPACHVVAALRQKPESDPPAASAKALAADASEQDQAKGPKGRRVRDLGEVKRKQRQRQRARALQKRAARAAEAPASREQTAFSAFCERISHDAETSDKLRVLEASPTSLPCPRPPACLPLRAASLACSYSHHLPAGRAGCLHSLPLAR